MKYITLSADYTMLDLKDEYTGESILKELPSEMNFKLQKWNKKYKKIIPLSAEERNHLTGEIDELDQEGLQICQKINQNLSENIKIRYFSEGKLQYLT